MQYPFFYQYRVRPGKENSQLEVYAGAIATIMVFASSDEVGRARCGRYLARNYWEIEEFMRVMAISEHHVENFDTTMRKIYSQAELYGIGACVDGWAKSPNVVSKKQKEKKWPMN